MGESVENKQTILMTPRTVMDYRAALVGHLATHLGSTLKEHNEACTSVQFSYGQFTSLIWAIKEAPIVYWRQGLRSAAVAGSDIFKDKAFTWDMKAAQMPLQLWIDEEVWVVKEGALKVPEDRATVVATLFVKDGLSLKMVWLLGGNPVNIREPLVVRWFSYPPTMEDVGACPPEVMEAQKNAWAGVIASFEFLALPIVSVEPTRLPRPDRRRLGKAGLRAPDIRIVYLRRKVREGTGVKSEVDWQHQWVVQGFWRNQWYAKEGVHKPIYVDTFMKGPEDKPLLAPRNAKTLYEVRR